MEVRDAGTKLENAIDWGARPYCQNAWSGKPGPLRPVFDGARTAVLRWTGRKRNREDHGIGAIMSIRAVKRNESERQDQPAPGSRRGASNRLHKSA